MKNSANSLDRMHDIVVPEPVSWWPPAVGWYVVFAVMFLIASYLAYLAWRRWKLNAYRREALRALEQATTVCAISTLLRRTALAVAPRQVIAAQLGSDWPNWLQTRCSISMSHEVSQQLTVGPYEPTTDPALLNELKQYAAAWIKHHDSVRPSATTVTSNSR